MLRQTALAKEHEVLSGAYRRIDAKEAQRLKSEGKAHLIEFCEGAGYVIYDDEAQDIFARNLSVRTCQGGGDA